MNILKVVVRGDEPQCGCGCGWAIRRRLVLLVVAVIPRNLLGKFVIIEMGWGSLCVSYRCRPCPGRRRLHQTLSLISAKPSPSAAPATDTAGSLSSGSRNAGSDADAQITCCKVTWPRWVRVDSSWGDFEESFL